MIGHLSFSEMAMIVPDFYLCCEAEDRPASSAFEAKRNPFGVRFNGVFGSEICHLRPGLGISIFPTCRRFSIG